MCVIIYKITFYKNDFICICYAIFLIFIFNFFIFYAILTEISLMTYPHDNIYLSCFILLLKCINVYNLP